MNDILMIVVLYRCISLIIGLIFGLFGYHLFALGIKAKAGDFNAAWGKKNVVLKRAAPGTFFAFFGILIICISLIKGPSIDRYYSKKLGGINYSGTVVWFGIEPHISKLIDKVLNNIELTNDEKRILRDWKDKNSKFSNQDFGRTVVHPHLNYLPVDNQKDNKANSADAKSRAAD